MALPQVYDDSKVYFNKLVSDTQRLEIIAKETRDIANKAKNIADSTKFDFDTYLSVLREFMKHEAFVKYVTDSGVNPDELKTAEDFNDAFIKLRGASGNLASNDRNNFISEREKYKTAYNREKEENQVDNASLLQLLDALYGQITFVAAENIHARYSDNFNRYKDKVIENKRTYDILLAQSSDRERNADQAEIELLVAQKKLERAQSYQAESISQFAKINADFDGDNT